MSEVRPGSPSPTVTRALAGSSLRQMREDAGLSRETVTQKFAKSPSWLGGVERGEYLPSARDQKDMLVLYGHPERIDWFERLRKGAHGRKDWWETGLFGSAAPAWLNRLLGFESIAEQVQAFDALVIGGLFQTPDTARALFRARRPALDTDEIERLTALRGARQAVLDGREEAPALQICSVVDEAVLRRQVGGPAVHHQQLRHLVTQAQRANVDLHILPTSVGAHAALDGPFMLLRFPQAFAAAPVVYAEDSHDGSYYREPDQVAKSAATFEALLDDALDPARSLDLIHAITKELYP